MTTSLSLHSLPPSAPRGYELHVDGDIVAEADDRDALTALLRRYAGYDRVAILPARAARG
jgi:hypothetical protein